MICGLRALFTCFLLLGDIRNTRRIAGVVRGGKYYSRPDLDRMLQQAAKAAVAQ
jgi:hypothetical protein